MDMDTFINTLPKAEMHLHIEGAVKWALMRQYIDEPTPAPETPEWWRVDYRYPDFTDFGRAMRPAVRALSSPERYGEVAQTIFADLINQNVRYVELSFGTDIHEPPLAIDEVAASIREAALPGLVVRVIGGVNRTKPMTPERADVLLAAKKLDGIDLHGDERHGTARPFASLYAAVTARGWPIIRAHAGELRGAESVRETLDALHVKRIEHGTRAAEDDELVQRLIDDEITLDMCPTSNLKLRVVESYETHPIGLLLRRGVRVTVNTDDPTAFGCTLTDEMHRLVEHQGFTQRELAQLQINAFHAAALPDDERKAIIQEIESLF